jgi:TonB family protein
MKHYKDTKLVGEEIDFYPNGKLYTIKEYDEKSLPYLKECRDSTGNLLTENGQGTWIKFDDDFKYVYEKGKVTEGREEGQWKGSEESKLASDSLIIVAVYEHGEMISGKHYDNKIFTSIDTNPEFKGGIAEFYNFLAHNVRYPVHERENNIQGRVFISFVVEKDGMLSNIKIIRGVSKGLDEEAMRVIKLSPRWTPGLLKGKPVRVRYNVPIGFSIAPEEIGSRR